MPEIFGRFYLKLTTNGNLLGEYSNQWSRSCSAEAGERDLGSEDHPVAGTRRFVGVYRSIWREDEGARTARLEISAKPDTEGIFSVAWRATDGGMDFDGEGMLCDETLIGNYWSLPQS